MIPADSKVRPEHLLRKAYVYVRQSSLVQVQLHSQSTLRQYALQARALGLGWQPQQIVVVDEDLGQSASQVGHRRAGFQRLLADLVTGEVGAVLSLEVSRLARQDSEGHRLVEVAALMGSLLIDEQQVYDPSLPDDRLLLGLKVLLSSNEIRLMHQRLQENKLRKAQRGELRLETPIGLCQDGKSGLCLDPNEQVQGAVRLFFERFGLSGCLSAVVRYFHDHGLLFPRRKGNWDGPVEWGRLSLQRARYLLVNPLYAGAYVYARTHLQAVVGPDQRIARKPRPLAPADWGAVRWEAFPGYIDRAEYERNQACLASNQNRVTLAQRGCRRDGCALLSGLVLCGRCGKRMYVSYSGQASQHVTYLCNTASMRYAQPACQRVPGAAVDRLVAEHLLAALTPAQVELSLAVAAELERQQGELERQWQRRIEGARYAVRLAQRRYEQVDPENRLVARTLEQSWENALREVQQLEQAYARFRQQTVLQLSPPQREQLFHLAQDLAQVWQAPTTTWAERKNLLELLVADVTLTRLEHGIRVQIRWHTNQVEEYQLPLPTLGTPPTPAPLLKRIRELTPTHTDGEIAHLLNQEGLKTATGNALTTRIVGDTRRRNHIRKRPPPSEVDS